MSQLAHWTNETARKVLRRNLVQEQRLYIARYLETIEPHSVPDPRSM